MRLSKVVVKGLALLLFSLAQPLAAQVKINEVMVKPQTDALSSQYQSMFNCPNPTYGNEWVELYNPDPCNAVDLTGYILGARTISTNYGAVMLPAGTSIAPLGFLVLGGPNAPNLNINLTSLCASANICIDGDGRWYMENGDGWVALYRPNGVVQDAVYWTFSSGEASKLTTDSDFASAPCTPAGSAAGALSPASSMGGTIGYAGVGPSIGTTVYRTTDGGATWATSGAATPGACNAACSTTSCILDAKITDFGGTPLKKEFYLYWETAQEMDVHHFIVERSFDGNHFSPIQETAARYPQGGHYFFQDPVDSHPVHYYRLLQVNQEGSLIATTQVLTLRQFGGGNELDVVAGPNPTRGPIQLTVSAADQDHLVLQVTDLHGKTVLNCEWDHHGGTEMKMLDMGQLTPGMYVWAIRGAQGTQHGKWLIEP